MALANKEQPRERRNKPQVVGVAGDNLHGNFYRLGRGGNIRQTRLRSLAGDNNRRAGNGYHEATRRL